MCNYHRIIIFELLCAHVTVMKHIVDENCAAERST